MNLSLYGEAGTFCVENYYVDGGCQPKPIHKLLAETISSLLRRNATMVARPRALIPVNGIERC
jgi:hypothetical protein